MDINTITRWHCPKCNWRYVSVGRGCRGCEINGYDTDTVETVLEMSREAGYRN